MTTINRERVSKQVEAILAAPTKAGAGQQAQVRQAAEWLLSQPDWYLDAAMDHYGAPVSTVTGELRARLAAQRSPIPGRILRAHEQTAARVAAAMAR